MVRFATMAALSLFYSLSRQIPLRCCCYHNANHRNQLHTSTAMSSPRKANLILGRHVKEAISNGSPIVALESTLITHGLPEPLNLELALSLERKVSNYGHGLDKGVARAATAGELLIDNPCISQPEKPALDPTNRQVTPATIGIIKGQLIIGLSREEIEYLATRERSKPIKASRRDIPIAMALGLSAGTTVSATMAIACSLKQEHGRLDFDYYNSSMTGGETHSPIKVFATGGTGGVHMGGESSMDISADLYEFARSPMGVVSSGFKSFLDTRRSLEFLETMGCTVMSLVSSSTDHYRATKTLDDDGKRSSCINNSTSSKMIRNDHLFPAFFSSTNREKILSPCIVRNIEEAAKILFHCLEAPLANRRASLLAVPIPEIFSLDEDDEILEVAMTSIREIDKRTDLEGKEKTPLILEQLNRATGGKTLRANIELLKNNSSIGAQLALKYAQLSNKTGVILERGFDNSNSDDDNNNNNINRSDTDLETNAKEIGSLTPASNNSAQKKPMNRNARKGDNVTHLGPIVVGCTMIDMHVSTKIDDHFKTNSRHSGITFQGRPHLTLGGVGRNLATALEFLGHSPTFITSLARDNLGSFALQELRKAGLSNGRLKVDWIGDINGDHQQRQQPISSSCFALVLMDSIGGQCEYVIANLDAAKAISKKTVDANLNQISKSPLLVMDANLTDESIVHLIQRCHQFRVPIFIEPTDVVVLPKLVASLKGLQKSDPKCLYSLLCLSPNLIELREMVHLFDGDNIRPEGEISLEQVERTMSRLMKIHLPQLKCLLVTMDKRGVMVALRSNMAHIEQVKLMEEAASAVETANCNFYIKHFETPQLIEKPISASGAGDSFASGFISGLLTNSNLTHCLTKGFQASLLALQDNDTIPLKLKNISIIQHFHVE